MSVETEIARINNAKDDIITAIRNTGVDVADNAKIDGLAPYVSEVYAAGANSGDISNNVVRATEIIDEEQWIYGCYQREITDSLWYYDGIEWLNPPMTAGTLYRTMERFDGMPVYKVTYSTGLDGQLVGQDNICIIDGLENDWLIVGIEGIIGFPEQNNSVYEPLASASAIQIVCNGNELQIHNYLQEPLSVHATVKLIHTI